MPIRTDGVLAANLRMPGLDAQANLIVSEVKQDVVIGMDVVDKYKLTWDWDTRTIQSSIPKQLDVRGPLLF